MSLKTDFSSTFGDNSCIKMIGFDMATAAAKDVYSQTGLGPQDAQVVELHDCFSANELVTYEALGLCPVGKAGQLVDAGDVTYGGKWVVNPSGGLISKGHPLGATGLAQCAELCWQVRQMAGPRQVPNCKVALQHSIRSWVLVVCFFSLVFGVGFPLSFFTLFLRPCYRCICLTIGIAILHHVCPLDVGLGGAVVVAMYRLGFPDQFKAFPAGNPNPALEDVRPAGLPAPTAPVKTPQAAAPAASGNAGPNKVTAGVVFTQLGSRVSVCMFCVLESYSNADIIFSLAFYPFLLFSQSDAELVNKIKGVYQFNVVTAKGTQSWTVDLKTGPTGSVKEAAAEKADCTLTMKEEDLVLLMTGKLDAQKAFMEGKLKLAGNMGLAMKLGDVIKPKSKM